VRLIKNRSQRTSKCGKNIASCATLLFLPNGCLAINYWTDARQHGIYLLNIYLYLTTLSSEVSFFVLYRIKRTPKPVKSKRVPQWSSGDLFRAMWLTIHCQSCLWRVAGQVFTDERNKHPFFLQTYFHLSYSLHITSRSSLWGHSESTKWAHELQRLGD